MVPMLPARVPRGERPFLQRLSRVGMRLVGWRIEGTIPNVTHCIIVGAPHTSNWDFVLAILAIFALDLRASWLGKHTFVNGPLRPLWQRLGGIPVDRRAPQGMVAQIVAQYRQQPHLILGVAPEGTRRRVDHWKLGFYYIARDAGVPIVPLGFDYGRRTLKIGEPIEAGEKTAVLQQLQDFYQGIHGKNPHQAFTTPLDARNAHSS